jgi:hypothetical protein
MVTPVAAAAAATKSARRGSCTSASSGGGGVRSARYRCVREVFDDVGENADVIEIPTDENVKIAFQKNDDFMMKNWVLCKRRSSNSRDDFVSAWYLFLLMWCHALYSFKITVVRFAPKRDLEI